MQPALPRPVPFGALILAALVTLAFLAAGLAVTPPAVRGANAPDQFDAVAARARLARVLGDESPHPIDSAAQDDVRERLLSEIEAIGLTPELRETFACRPHPNNPLIDCMMVRNVVFAIGPDQGPAVLAVTHYDSVPAAPGASDAGIGIAAWLEVARVLAREPLARRVIFVITDGEEIALMGAHVFATQDPDMQPAEALINLEARGTRGPAMFFETNQPNADAVAAFAGAPRSMGNSVSADVYALLPNDTDVTELRREGLDVINIALLDGLENYHTPRDTLASQDPRSLQHMGDAALHATRRLASTTDQGDPREMAYTDIAGRMFVSTPSWLAQGVLGLGALIAALAFWRAERAGRWRALAAPVLALVIAGASAFAALYAFTALRGGAEFWMAHPLGARAWCVMLGVLALLVSLWLLNQRNAAQAGAAAMLWFALTGLALTLVTPGIAIMFAPIALTYAVFALVALFWPPALAIGAGAAALLSLVVWAPWLYLLELALGFSMAFVNAILVVLALAPLCGALVRLQGGAPWRGTVAIFAGATMLAIGVAAALPSYSPARPLSLNINVLSDGVAGETFVTAGPARRALPRALADAAAFAPRRLLPGDRGEGWAAPVEAEIAARPTLEDVRMEIEDGARVWRARLRTNGAYRVMVRIPRAAAPQGGRVNGAGARFDAAGQRGDFVSLACQGRSCDGAELAVTLEPGGEIEPWFLLGFFPNTTLPASRAIIARRGEAVTPFQFGDSVITLDAVAHGE